MSSILKVILENDKCRLSAEINEDLGILLHLDVFKWSKTFYKVLLADFVEVLDFFKNKTPVTTIYSVAPNEKVKKFCFMFGFEETDKWISYGGERMEVMQICLQQQ